ncbi:MAG: hypothetical protein K9K76_02185 [Halanaerobiales bacterium]|nr:hypothetical protein [Halanaerobiales bacterium]
MSVHQYDENMRPDEEFVEGDFCYLVPGNKCRLLDGRRTTGNIEEYFEESDMFRWRITKYEDKGKYWDLPAEEVKRFQFEKDSKQLGRKSIKKIESTVRKYNSKITIKADPKDREQTQNKISKTKKQVKEWLNDNSIFLKENKEIDFTRKEGYKSLYKDIKNYMKDKNLIKQENLTTNSFVLNPESGEWVKGLKIVLAELGMVTYQGKKVRTDNIFKGVGEKTHRRKYIIHRLAFMRAFFELMNLKEVIVYRGMSTEKGWIEKNRTFLSCTYNYEVANAFSSMERVSKYKNSYILKMTLPIEKLFMTFFETASMNNQYKESEALLLYNKKIQI